MLIPKTAHFVWLGNSVPERVAKRFNRFVELNPSWDVMFWGEREVDLLGLSACEAYWYAKTWSERSNRVRMEALSIHGGIYFDADVVWQKALDSSFIDWDKNALWLSSELGVSVGCAFMACPPKHRALAQALADLREYSGNPRELNRRHYIPFASTLLARLARTRGDILPVPREHFAKQGTPGLDPYAWHLHENSWRFPAGQVPRK